MILHHPGDLLRQNTKQDVKKGNMSRRTLYGDILRKKKEKENFRVVFQNINGLGTSEESDKRDILRQFINEYKVDCLALAEVNINWKLIGKKQTLHAYARESFSQSKVVVSHNIWGQTKKPHQQGGVAIMTAGDMALRIKGSKQDDKRLGRWCSSAFRGKHGIVTRIVSVYVPCGSNKKKKGPETVFAQQQAALLRMKRTKGVMESFWYDLWKSIDDWIADGEQLIICGDWNEDVYEDEIRNNFKKRNMVPGITGRHKDQAPPTYNNGSHPIDEIFCTSGLVITGSGFLEHGINEGDHCPLWIEFTKQSLLGTLPPDIATYQPRRLKTHDPNIVKKYNIILEEEFEKYGVYKRSLDLYNQFADKLTPHQQAEYDALDIIRVRAMAKAERKCRKLHMGALPWSPSLQYSRNLVQYIKLTMRRKQGRRVGARVLIRLSTKVGVNMEDKTVQELAKQLYEANKVYKSKKKEAASLRRSFLDYLATALEQDGQGKKANIIKNLIKIEEQRATYRRLAVLSKKCNDNLSTTTVLVTLPSGRKVEISEKQEMENAIIAENTKKYHQCENSCPFLTSPLTEVFGSFGETSASTQVMNGTFVAPVTENPLTQLFIDTCEKSNHTTSMKRTPDEFKRSWKAMKEKTGTHSIHFGHFIAACKHDHTLLVHYIMAEIPFRTGHSPRRWQQATNVMILKKSGLFDIERLRTLCLFQADFNHNNKFLGSQLMKHSVSNDMIAHEQFSITGKKSISHALNKTLLFDNTRYQKGCLALTSCDLKSCYDRIAHTPAKLAAQSMGIPEAPLLSFFATLQDIQYYTRTVYGVSEQSFGGLDIAYEHKPQGVGQGNGAAPQLWSIISTKMFQMLHTLGLATSIVTPITHHSLPLAGFAYVDDSDLFASRPDGDIDLTVNKMQEVVTNWEYAAKVTGGALAPEKCWWYLLAFEWDDTGAWKYKTIDESTTIYARDAMNSAHSIKLLQSHEAQEMLGVYIAPNGSCQEQLRQMKDKARKYGELVRSNHLQRHEAWLGLTTMALKSIEYCLPATTLTKAECREVMWILIKAFLPAAGINRNMKSTVIHAPPAMQGLGLQDIYLTQGINHINDIVEHTWKKGITGQFITASMEFLRLELGVNIDILNSSYDKYKSLVLTSSWITNSWEFASQCGISVGVNVARVEEARYNDKPIMELILDHDDIHTEEIVCANECRMYLKVFNISEIVTGDGRRITTSAWEGYRDTDNKAKDLQWPEWGRPSEKMWTTWRKVLHKVITSQREKFLDLPLGKWYKFPSYWTWHIDENNNLFHKGDDDEWKMHKQIGRSQRRMQYAVIGKICSPPPKTTISPTTVQKGTNFIVTEGTSLAAPQVAKNNVSSHYTDWLLYDVKMIGKISDLIDALATSRIITVSDGSYNPLTHVGTAAWIIVDDSFKPIVKGLAIVPGSKYVQSAFRSEAVGVLAVFEFLHSVCLRHSIQSGTVTVMCDNEKVLHITKEWLTTKLTPNHTNSDIISPLLFIRDKLPLILQTQHVRGHQDYKVAQCNLSSEARLNIAMDQEAKNLSTTISRCPSLCPSYSTHPFAFPTCSHNGVKMEHNLKTSLYNSIMKTKMLDYWDEKERVPYQLQHTVDYDAMAAAAKSMNLNMRRFVAKWSCQCLGTGKNMQRWQLRHAGNCPYCLAEKEDTLHIMTCTNVQAIEGWNIAIGGFFNKIHKIKTCWYVITALKEEIRAWRLQLQSPDLNEYPLLLQQAIIEQRRLGWKQFFEGIISTKWELYMRSYYGATGNYNSSTKWAKQLIQQAWNMTFNIWNERNKQLHETQRIQDLEGVPTLQTSLRMEWQQGLGRLPASEYSGYFTQSLEDIMLKSIDTQKQWLLTVRQGRILLDPTNLIHDEFASSNALQKWLGVSYEVTDEEMLPILQDAIRNEIRIGLGNLPAQIYEKIFNISLNTLITQSLAKQKLWFQKVRQGRICMDPSNLMEDEFMTKGPIQAWIDLST